MKRVVRNPASNRTSVTVAKQMRDRIGALPRPQMTQFDTFAGDYVRAYERVLDGRGHK